MTNLPYFRLCNDQSFLDCKTVSVCEKSGDYFLGIQVCSGKFTATQEVWVEAADFDGFMQGLGKLSKNFEGEACLNSMSPDEFYVTVRLLNKRGYFSVTGKLKALVYTENASFVHELHFGFEIDASVLKKAVEGLITP